VTTFAAQCVLRTVPLHSYSFSLANESGNESAFHSSGVHRAREPVSKSSILQAVFAERHSVLPRA
jgi:hypothetical protein